MQCSFDGGLLPTGTLSKWKSNWIFDMNHCNVSRYIGCFSNFKVFLGSVSS